MAAEGKANLSEANLSKALQWSRGLMAAEGRLAGV